MSYLNTHQHRDTRGCCIIGMFLAFFYVIWNLIRAVARLLWRGSVYLFKALYYFYAWPILAIEYLWKRGGIYRIIGVALTIMLMIALAVGILSSSNSNTPDALQPVEAASFHTITANSNDETQRC